MNPWRMLKQVPFFVRVRKEHGLHNQEALDSWQHRHMVEHVQWVVQHAPYYAALYQGLDPQHWRQFPVIEKKQWMEHFDTLNTRGLKKETAMAMALGAEHSRDFTGSMKGVTVGLSSGTSGNRGLFLASAEEQAHYAAAVLARVLPQPLWQKHTVAFFLRSNNLLYQSTQNPFLTFCYFDLMDSLQQHLQRLQSLQASLLVAPPSVLRYVAQWVKQGVLTHTFKKIISVAEVLDPVDRVFFESAFQQPVHQVYQCTEGFIAATCEKGTLHVNEDMLVVQKEYICNDGVRFVPVISDFFRRTQPVIRYRLNDVLIERKEPCPCGSARMALDAVEGRCDDVLYMKRKDSAFKQPVFADFIRKAVMMASEDIEGYYVEQTAPDVLHVAVDGHFKDTEKAVFLQVEQSLQCFLQQQGCFDIAVKHIPYETPYGPDKMRRIRNKTIHPSLDA